MVQYAVYLENICFSYEKHVVIKNLSLRAKPGEHIGIVGDSGCGKSTLLKILAGLYTPDHGTAVIAGEHLPENIRKQVALVMQNNSLFPLSIRDNITCGHDISDETVWAACQNASLANWIEKLPNGLDTKVGERETKCQAGRRRESRSPEHCAKMRPSSC